MNETNIYPPYMMGYSQLPQNYVIGLSLTNENYGMSNYSPSTQMLYHIPYQM